MNTIKWLVVGMWLSWCAVHGYQKVQAQSIGSDLVEIIGNERIGYNAHYTRLHDKASGVEILCMKPQYSDSYSCVPTGRNWK